MPTDWKKCFICQKSRKGTNKEKVRSTTEGLQGIGAVIQKLIDNNEIDIVVSRLIEEVNDASITNVLLENEACYHHTCILQYNKKEKECNKKDSSQGSENENVPRTSKRISVERRLGELKCLFCSNEDTFENLCEAGTRHATKRKADGTHAQEKAKKWREMALTLGNEDIAQKLAVGDLASNELFYHNECLTEFHNIYNKTLKESDTVSETNRVKWCEASALSKVINSIYEKDRENPGSSFSVKSLEQQYIELLHQQGIKYSSHVTRFADKLVVNVEGLIKDTSNKTTMVYLQKNISSMMYSMCDEPNAFLGKLREIIKPIRDAMASHKNEFHSVFDKDSQVNAVPMILMTLVSMLVDGASVENRGFSQGALSAAQIIMYNFRKKTKKTQSAQRRYSKHLETPLVIYNSLKLYSETRSKTAIDELHNLGLGISYLRTLDITKNLYDSQRSQYERDGVLVPCVMRKNLFTILAKDNIDLNARSTNAKSHYHGTSLSGLQYPTAENSGSVLARTYEDASPASKKLDGLPKEYCDVGPLPSNHGTKDIFAPLCTVNLPSYFEALPGLSDSIKLEYEWLSTFEVGTGDGWARHHSSFGRAGDELNIGINGILPMINKQVHTLETQHHVMSLNKKMTNFLNPSQTPVDTGDQPVYALTKTIQWLYPHNFGQGMYMSILGGLHIEQSVLVMHGELIKGSGLNNVLDINDLSIIGTSAAVDVNDIKRARYCLQVAACAIYRKLKDAHSQSNSELSVLKWLDMRSTESEMCFYWKLILDFQVLALVLIRSIREGNFQVYVESLVSISKWYFALDHYHYARWCTVQCFDLMLLESTCPDVYNEFTKGNFTFQKTNSKFSRLAVDQIHEQNNKVIKGSGGAKHLLNMCDESGLIRWETVGTDIARILSEFEESINQPVGIKIKKHHEDNDSFQESFSADVQKVYNGIVSNPFSLSTLTSISNTSLVFPDVVFHNISLLESTGKKQFDTFSEERLIRQKVSIDSKITKNQFVLPAHVDPTEKKTEKSKKCLVIKEGTITKLRSALQHRETETKKIFQNELLGVAHSIALTPTTLYHSKKSAITDRFTTANNNPNFDSASSAIVIEMSAMIMIKAKCDAETFHDFAMILYHYIMDQAKRFERVDIVCDQYFDNSLKEGTRKGRGHGSRKIFDDDTKFPEKMREDFLKHSENKEQLNRYLAEKFMDFHTSSTKSLTITHGDTVKSTNIALLNDVRINSCTSEEADARLVRHAISCVESSYDMVVVRTVDTDVLILLMSSWPYMSELGPSQVYSLMGKESKNLKLYDIKELSLEVGYDLCKGIPFFYAFTGCDTVSSMYHCSKLSFWDSLNKQPNKGDLLRVFQQLSEEPEDITSEQIDILERFVLRVYYPQKLEANSLDTERAAHFQRQAVANIRQLPLSRAGLIEHVKRACIQGGWLWRECLHNVRVPDVTKWGWEVGENGGFIPCWQKESDESTMNIEDVIQTCSCRTSRCKSCKCQKMKWSCLPFCGCEKTCTQ